MGDAELTPDKLRRLMKATGWDLGFTGEPVAVYQCQEASGNIADSVGSGLTARGAPIYASGHACGDLLSPFVFTDHRTGETVTLHRAPGTSDEDWYRYVMKEMGWTVLW